MDSTHPNTCNGEDTTISLDVNRMSAPKVDSFIPLLDDSTIGNPAIMKDIESKPASKGEKPREGAAHKFLRLNGVLPRLAQETQGIVET